MKHLNNTLGLILSEGVGYFQRVLKRDQVQNELRTLL